MKARYNKREIMQTAHKNYRRCFGSWSDCLRAAWGDAFFAEIDFGMTAPVKVSGTKAVYSKSETSVNNLISVMKSIGYNNTQIAQLIN